MSLSSRKRAALLTVALVALLLQLVRAPIPTLGVAVLFAATWWFPRHRHVDQRRHTRGRHMRQRVASTALVAAGLWTGIALLRAVRDLLATVPLGDQSVVVVDDTDPAAPWPGAFLLDGLVSVAAIAGALTGTLGRSRRRRRHPEAERWAMPGDAHQVAHEGEPTV